MILRPAPEDTRVISASNGNRPNGALRNGATRPPASAGSLDPLGEAPLHQERAGPRSAFITVSGWRKMRSGVGGGIS